MNKSLNEICRRERVNTRVRALDVAALADVSPSAVSQFEDDKFTNMYVVLAYIALGCVSSVQIREYLEQRVAERMKTYPNG